MSPGTAQAHRRKQISLTSIRCNAPVSQSDFLSVTRKATRDRARKSATASCVLSARIGDKREEDLDNGCRTGTEHGRPVDLPPPARARERRRVRPSGPTLESTPLSDTLRSDAPDSQRYTALNPPEKRKATTRCRRLPRIKTYDCRIGIALSFGLELRGSLERNGVRSLARPIESGEPGDQDCWVIA